MEKNGRILKEVRITKDLDHWHGLFQALGQLPGTEYRPTERERQRVRDHAAQLRGRPGQ